MGTLYGSLTIRGPPHVLGGSLESPLMTSWIRLRGSLTCRVLDQWVDKEPQKLEVAASFFSGDFPVRNTSLPPKKERIWGYKNTHTQTHIFKNHTWHRNLFFLCDPGLKSRFLWTIIMFLVPFFGFLGLKFTHPSAKGALQKASPLSLRSQLQITSWIIHFSDSKRRNPSSKTSLKGSPTVQSLLKLRVVMHRT